MFTPDKNEAQIVPFFEDAKAEDGWQGHTTTKTLKRLQDEVKEAIARLGASVVSFQQGTFQIDQKTRQGFRVHYVIEGRVARLDIAALPVRNRYNNKKKEQSLKMALYMLEIGLSGAWVMQQLSPGYAPLMPFILTEGDKTISEMWIENSAIGRLLPPRPEEFIEGEEIK